MKTVTHSAQFCVIGGGMAGLCAALAAARHSVKTIIMQDRPVFGGNASSEIRMHVCGSHGKDNRETGICEELFLENFAMNPNLSFSVWDSVLYGKALTQENLTFLLNCTCQKAEVNGGVIKSVTGWTLNSETYHIINADYYADCSGDSILAPLTGAEYMYGREAKSDFGETIPPDVADSRTMGMSCLIMGRETDHPVPFKAPSWAYKIDGSKLKSKGYGRDTNFWWIEYGGMGDCIHDTDKCRDELMKIAFGVWDFVKNGEKTDFENFELDWVGFLPGKRESRRYAGDHVITQNDVEAGGNFPDTVAYAGWTMDDHFPEGFYYDGGHPTIYHPAPTPWTIPWRALYSKNIKNLMFAGRNISVTHATLSSSRVMSTCAILGQAVGTAAYVMTKQGSSPKTLDIDFLQQTLMDDDCFLPGVKRKLPELTEKARLDEKYALLRNGISRGEQNVCILKKDDAPQYVFEKPEFINGITLVFDSDLNRPFHNMPSHYYLGETRFRTPKTLIKDFDIELTLENGSTEKIEIRGNYQRFVRLCVNIKAVSARLIPLCTHGCEDFRVFAFELF